ncbi:MAG: PHP domain-containing protein [Lachnospiraceae bacterium]|nr:PHP domain-containing protein [Lachnospiraceae bacterium]
MAIQFECDLHGHTKRSDGNDTPLEFINHAVELGMKVAAITDHDIIPPVTIEVDGQTVDTQEYALSKGLKLLLGIEVSCETYIDDVHLVCFGCDWDDPYWAWLDDFVVKSKIEGYRMLAEALNENGMPMSWAEVLDNNGNPVEEQNVQKKMIFELMARKGYCPTWQDAKLFVKNNKEIVIKRPKPSAESVIKEVKRMGGIVIMAHPYLVSEPIQYEDREITRKEYIDILINAGLDGIEASYTYDKTSYGGTMTKDEIIAEVKELYKDRLFISGGSDYHNDGKKGVKNPRDIGDCGITIEELMQYDKLAALLP